MVNAESRTQRTNSRTIHKTRKSATIAARIWPIHWPGVFGLPKLNTPNRSTAGKTGLEPLTHCPKWGWRHSNPWACWITLRTLPRDLLVSRSFHSKCLISTLENAFEGIAFLWFSGIIQTTGERSSRRREWTTAIKRIGAETREASRQLDGYEWQ